MSENATTCINCEAKMDSNYCPTCGQRAKVLPITWRGLFVGLTSRWLGMDNKLMRTVWGLMVRPTQVINAYLDGNRVRYIGPLSYLIVMSAIFILTFEVAGVSPREFLEATSEKLQPQSVTGNAEVSENQKAFMENYMQSISENMRLMTGALIPFFALSMLIFYRGRNFLQNFLVVTYATSELIWLSIISIIVFATLQIPIQVYLTIPSLLYMLWIFTGSNPQKNKIWTWLKAFFTWVVGYSLFMVAIFIAGITYFILFVFER